MSVRLILKNSCQTGPDDWSVFYETVVVENAKLEKILKNKLGWVVGAELETPKETPKVVIGLLM